MYCVGITFGTSYVVSAEHSHIKRSLIHRIQFSFITPIESTATFVCFCLVFFSRLRKKATFFSLFVLRFICIIFHYINLTCRIFFAGLANKKNMRESKNKYRLHVSLCMVIVRVEFSSGFAFFVFELLMHRFSFIGIWFCCEFSAGLLLFHGHEMGP